MAQCKIRFVTRLGLERQAGDSENGDRTCGLTDVSTRTKQGEEMVARLSNYLH